MRLGTITDNTSGLADLFRRKLTSAQEYLPPDVKKSQ